MTHRSITFAKYIFLLSLTVTLTSYFGFEGSFYLGHPVFLIRDRKNPDCRKFSIKIAVGVAKEALSSDNTIGISSLASAIGSLRNFAAKNSNAVLLERTEELYKRRTNSNSIFITDIPERLTEFLSNAEHSQALPRNETVSVGYGKRHSKSLLKKSKLDLALALLFKKETPDVTFSTRVLLCE